MSDKKPANVSDEFKARIRELNNGLPDDGSWQIGPAREQDAAEDGNKTTIVEQESLVFDWSRSMAAACRAAKQMYEGMDGDDVGEDSGIDPGDDKITAERLLSVGFTQTGMVFSWQYGYSCGTKKMVYVWIGETPSILMCGDSPFPHVTTWSRFQLLLKLLKPE